MVKIIMKYQPNFYIQMFSSLHEIETNQYTLTIEHAT